MSKETGGPAFPTEVSESGEDGYEVPYFETGMTLRDYFASKAMQGLYQAGKDYQATVQMIAHEAYEIADAMLKERSK